MDGRGPRDGDGAIQVGVGLLDSDFLDCSALASSFSCWSSQDGGVGLGGGGPETDVVSIVMLLVTQNPLVLSHTSSARIVSLS